MSYNKYSNIKTKLDGYTFASMAEANRYAELKLLARAGAVRNIELQPEFELQPKYKYQGKTVQAIKYRADFAYDEVLPNGCTQHVIEDSKGFRTEIYRFKKKILLYKYPELIFRET